MKTMTNTLNKTGKRAALKIAYDAIKELGYTHQGLVKKNLGVIYKTLRNIRDDKPMKDCTIDFYLKLFVSLLDKESQNRFMVADTEGGGRIYKTMIKILLVEHELLEV